MWNVYQFGGSIQKHILSFILGNLVCQASKIHKTFFYNLSVVALWKRVSQTAGVCLSVVLNKAFILSVCL